MPVHEGCRRPWNRATTIPITPSPIRNQGNIVHIDDISSSGTTDYIALEFVDGKTLDRFIGRSGVALRDALKYAIQVAGALARAHSAGIVHRDLKPAKVIVIEDGRLKLLDSAWPSRVYVPLSI
jgi:serine/threonine protein kinase